MKPLALLKKVSLPYLVVPAFALALDSGCKAREEAVGTTRITSGTPGEATPATAEPSSVNAAQPSDMSGVHAVQSNKPEDLEITRAVRAHVAEDPYLSPAARNVEVVTADRTVTLRGLVPSSQEKQIVETIARSLHGVDRVDNQIETEHF
jgi:hypothetical protein